jgi:hypothetical protein
MNVVNPSHDCAPRHRKGGVRNRADSRNFAVIDFRAYRRRGGGGQHPESCQYGSTAARAGVAEGAPPDSPGGGAGRLRSGSAVYVEPPLVTVGLRTQCLLLCFCFSFCARVGTTTS